LEAAEALFALTLLKHDANDMESLCLRERGRAQWPKIWKFVNLT
jgi:hypothetical protein